MYSQDYINGQNNGLIVGMTMGLKIKPGCDHDIYGWARDGAITGGIWSLFFQTGGVIAAEMPVQFVSRIPLETMPTEPNYWDDNEIWDDNETWEDGAFIPQRTLYLVSFTAISGTHTIMGGFIRQTGEIAYQPTFTAVYQEEEEEI